MVGDFFSLIWQLIVGLIVGVLARLILPGREAFPDGPLGWLLTALLGVAGAFIGGVIARSIRSFGFFERKLETKSMNSPLPSAAGAVTCKTPSSSAGARVSPASASSRPWTRGAQRSKNRSPCSLRLSLRVVRLIKFEPSLASRSATLRLTLETGMPSERAAPLKLPSSATRTKMASSFRSGTALSEIFLSLEKYFSIFLANQGRVELLGFPHGPRT